MSEVIEEKIIEVLKEPRTYTGTTVAEIAEQAGISRITVQNYLRVLEAKGLIEKTVIGKTGLYRLVEDGV